MFLDQAAEGSALGLRFAGGASDVSAVFAQQLFEVTPKAATASVRAHRRPIPLTDSLTGTGSLT
jgi:hypothetical protein